MKRPRSGRPSRRSETREPRRVIRVLTEGAVTEPDTWFSGQGATATSISTSPTPAWHRSASLSEPAAISAPIADPDQAVEAGASMRSGASLTFITTPTWPKRFKKPTRADNIEALLAGYSEARERAQALHDRHVGNGSDPTTNPSTNLWELIERLR